MREKQASIATARQELAALVHEVEEGAKITLTRRGKAVAVLISVAEYRRLSGDSSGFWEALTNFRKANDLASLDLCGALEDLRDRGDGRSVSL